MSLLIETIRADDGRFEELSPHCERMNRTGRVLFGTDKRIRPGAGLEAALQKATGSIGEGRWKIRVLYDSIIRRVDVAAYYPRMIGSAALVDGRGIEYSFKYADRSGLRDLERRAELSGADSALIVSEGRITDFTYANAAFFDGRFWWTPVEPLLYGTRRSRLLESGVIMTEQITCDDLSNYVSVSPVNAMLELGEIMIDIKSIKQEII